jgi:predicted lysophospholipase L1 biosynthesis ABC-type transport system permease subunit
MPAPGWYPSEGRQRWWDGQQWTENYGPQPLPAVGVVPGRIPGFVCGLIAMFFTTLPIVSIPLGVVGWVQSAKALRKLPAPSRGRGLSIAGLVLSILALSLTAIIILLALPGIIRANFG